MKKILLLTILIPFIGKSQVHKGEFGTYIPITIPVKSEMPYMSTAVGFGFKGAYKPSYHLPIAFELKTSWNNYSSRTINQTFLFSDGSGTNTDVTYSSGFNQSLFGVKFQIGNDTRLINGFVSPQIGTLKMRSKIIVADPNDEDGCEALDRETTQKFRGSFYGGEAGVDIDFALFGKNTEAGNHKLSLSASYMQVFGNFQYVNVKHMKDHTHHLMAGGEVMPVTEDGRTDINTTFINVSTQDIHEHKIAELYTTGLRMWQINIGYTLRF